MQMLFALCIIYSHEEDHQTVFNFELFPYSHTAIKQFARCTMFYKWLLAPSQFFTQQKFSWNRKSHEVSTELERRRRRTKETYIYWFIAIKKASSMWNIVYTSNSAPRSWALHNWFCFTSSLLQWISLGIAQHEQRLKLRFRNGKTISMECENVPVDEQWLHQRRAPVLSNWRK